MKAIFCFAILANLIANALSFNFSSIDLNKTNSSSLLTLTTDDPYDNLGWVISSAGDVNGDGIDDLIVGAPDRNSFDRKWSGRVYVIYGSTGGFPKNIDLDNFDLTKGFHISGATEMIFFGRTVGSAGDVNGDGVDDVIIGAPLYSFESGSNQIRAAYIIYGRVGGVQSHIDLNTTLALSQGVQITGLNGMFGSTVSSAGDINGDGIDDILIGSFSAIVKQRGVAYIIYGRQGGFESHMNMKNPLSTDQGFQIIYGVSQICSVSSAGDVNADRIDDLIVGACTATPSGRQNAGITFIIYGEVGGFEATIDLNAPLEPYQGFQISGNKDDFFGSSVSSAGDVNGDGFDDVLISSFTSSPLGRVSAGTAYVFYGSLGLHSDIDLAAGLELTRGFQVIGANNITQVGYYMSSLGDINGDGADDVMIGTAIDNLDGKEPDFGAYVLYGKAGGVQGPIDLLYPLNQSQGFNISGGLGSPITFISVGSGDFNNDGLIDIFVGAAPLNWVYVIYSGKEFFPFPSLCLSFF